MMLRKGGEGVISFSRAHICIIRTKPTSFLSSSLSHLLISNKLSVTEDEERQTLGWKDRKCIKSAVYATLGVGGNSG